MGADAMSIRHVLVVDDSRSARMVLRRMLQEEHLEVDTAESAEAALDYLAHVRPDAIFMDQTMPGMDGLQAVSLIKSNVQTAAIPVAMYTSREGEAFADQARARGAVGLLPKPATRESLGLVLRQLNEAATAALAVSSKVVRLKPAGAAEAAPAPPPPPLVPSAEDLASRVAAAVEQALEGRLDAVVERRIEELREALEGSVRAGVMELVTSLCDSRLNTLSSRLELKLSAQLADLRENFSVSGNLDQGIQEEIRAIAHRVAGEHARAVGAERADEVARVVAAHVVESQVELLAIRLEQQLQERLDRMRSQLDRTRRLPPELVTEVRETARSVAMQHAQRIATETAARAAGTAPTGAVSTRARDWLWPALAGGVGGALAMLAIETMI